MTKIKLLEKILREKEQEIIFLKDVYKTQERCLARYSQEIADQVIENRDLSEKIKIKDMVIANEADAIEALKKAYINIKKEIKK